MALNFVIEISLYRDSHVKISQSYEWHSSTIKTWEKLKPMTVILIFQRFRCNGWIPKPLHHYACQISIPLSIANLHHKKCTWSSLSENTSTIFLRVGKCKMKFKTWQIFYTIATTTSVNCKKNIQTSHNATLCHSPHEKLKNTQGKQDFNAKL